jgi:hypothetical protein
MTRSGVPNLINDDWLTALPGEICSRRGLARDPTKRLSYGSCTGWFTSRKAQLRMPFESLIERDAMIVLESDQSVSRYRAQPETFQISSGGRSVKYTPDLLVWFRRGDLVYREVKPTEKLIADTSLGGRFESIQSEAHKRGATFETWSAAEIRREPRLSNSKLVQSASGYITQEILVAALPRLARMTMPATVEEIAVALGAGAHHGLALGLVGLGLLSIDIDEEILPTTLLTRSL